MALLAVDLAHRAQSRLERALHPAREMREMLAREVDAALRLLRAEADARHLTGRGQRDGALRPWILVPDVHEHALVVLQESRMRALHLVRDELLAFLGLHVPDTLADAAAQERDQQAARPGLVV